MLIPVYHTTENRGNENVVINAKGIFATDTELYLGKGFYYWEGIYDLAKYWGISRYKGNYSIFAADFDCNTEKLFNLQLNTHLALITTLNKEMRKKNMPIGMFIDFLLDFQKEKLINGEITEDELFFPFWYSLALDYSEYDKNFTKWFTNSVNKGFYATKPCNFICIYETKHLTLNNFRHIKSYGNIVNV